MITINDKKDCCGCWACENVCPKNCITMQEDNEGFRYPVVNVEDCIDCHRCEKVCPIINVAPEKGMPLKGSLIQHKDEKVLAESTSGGAFTAIAQYVIEKGGVVFGAALDDNEARHIAVESVEELFRFRNSKYVQSIIGDTFTEAKELLMTGRLVCFSGTPCQMEGLLTFLGKPYENLVTVDVVCRAVPSPKVLRKYLEYQSSKFGEQLQQLKFRDKQYYGYKYSNMSFCGNGKKYHEGIDTDPWLRSFFSGVNVRPSCFTCKFKKIHRPTDFTIWDCFDVYKYDKEMDNDKGVTKLLAHSQKAVDILTIINSYAIVKEIEIKTLIAGVNELKASTKESPQRNDFFAEIDIITPDKLFSKYFPITLSCKAEKFIRLTMLRMGMGMYKQLRKLVKLVIGEVKR